jgi:Zn-finger nucleic acid-binding protein
MEACRGCGGVLVAQASLVRLLEVTSADLLDHFDPDVAVASIADSGERISCPSCDAKMEADDYCAAGLVRFDRCPACHLLWLDPAKLGTMTLMWARMEARLARVRAQSRALEKDLAHFVSEIIFSRTVG